MRNMIKALVLAVGIVGASAAAQAAPVSSAQTLGVSDAPIVHVQMHRMERRRMMRHRMMRHEMRHDRRMMRRHMMHRM
jgi:response regulator of citrate/malate metabolism